MERSEYFLDYDLPHHLIAQHPVEPRDASRLLLVDRGGQSFGDYCFSNLPDLLRPGDLLVVNDSRVIPARIAAQRETGGRVEIVLLERQDGGIWEALARPLGRLRKGEVLRLAGVRDESEAQIQFVGRRGSLALVRIDDESVIDRYGDAPLPPYIDAALDDRERYQTVYAQEAGSAAAPTAGLHFTAELLERCRLNQIERASLTLHVGIDTFKPLGEGDPDQHEMHSEWYSAPQSTWEAIIAAKNENRRVVSVGTTTTRVLETIGHSANPEDALTGRTSIFIKPPFDFKVVDAQITNFHLPRTTLLLMISAFTGGDLLRRAYEHAIRQEYRFYSFGDAMLIV